ncbi:diguanylate phosphodiesterase [Burkholderia sp. H160]|nr:diguanylate phosphodiesterase [Burkholderia sp. H160]
MPLIAPEAKTGPDWKIAREVVVAIEEDRLFFRHEVIRAIDAPADVLYRETLVRMKAADMVLPPGRFIPALERLSLMRPFDCFVLRRTLDALRAVPDANLGCNISAQSVRDDHWWKSLFLELAAAPDLAARLIVEVTESAPVSAVDGAAFVRRLKDLGVRVAVDDFGVGFSADAARMCEPDIIKVDRSFLRRVRQGSFTAAELNRLVRAARRIAPLLVIEGVETADDVLIARNAGVEWIQGYYLDAPDVPFPAIRSA